MDKAGKWFGPLSGVLFVVAVVLAGSVFGGFDAEPSDPASTVLAEFGKNADDIQAAALLTMLGVGFLLLFMGHLRTRLRGGGAGWAADGFLAGGVAFAGGWILLASVQLAGGVAGELGHAEVAQGAVDFLWSSSLIFSPGLLAVGIAAAAASFVTRALPVWLGVFAVVVALGALAPWIGIFVFIAWVLAASIAGFVEASRPATTVEVR